MHICKDLGRWTEEASDGAADAGLVGLVPRCRFQEEDSEEYGSPMVMATAIADLIKQRTKSHLRKIQAAFSSKPIFMRAEYAHCPSLTIIDTPGFVLKAKRGEPESTPDEIRSMVKSLVAPPDRLVLFLQQSSVQWCMSDCLDTLKEIDPTFRRTMIVISKFDNRLKEFTERQEVDNFLSARGYLSDSIHPFFVALPMDCGTISNEEFRRQICQVDIDVNALLRGAVLAPKIWGKTTEEEQMHSGIGSWPGINMPVKPANSSLKLYGSAAFVRLMDELRCAAYSKECPQVSREQVANTLPCCTGSSRLTEAAAKIARVAARSWLAPLIDTACDRLAFVLQSLLDLAMERKRNMDSQNHQNVEDMDSYVGFLAALRCSYCKFVEELSKQCKQIVREDLDFVYQRICYDNDFLSGVGSVANSMSRFNHFTGVTSNDLADSGYELEEAQENSSPRDQQHMTPLTNKGNESKEVLRESQLTVPEMPSPDLPSDIHGGKKKDNGTPNDSGPRKRHARMAAYTNRNHHDSMIGADDMGLKSGSSYSTICTISAQYFAKMQEVLIETNVPNAMNSGFLTPCCERLLLALDVDLFAVSDDKFMDMFAAPGAVDAIQKECQSLLKRQKILLSCLNEFKNISRAL